MAGETPRIEYIEARRVLLDALDALRSHLGAIVLVGAQAVYLRTAGRIEGYQPFTTDADSKAGRRAARLPGQHGKTTARKSPGLAGAVVDNGPLELASLEGSDLRQITVNVAGYGALLVAKLHKLGDRLVTPDRLYAKDAGDIYRLFDTIAPGEMATIVRALLDDTRSAATTAKALDYLDQLYLTPRSVGVRLAVDALRGLLPEETVVAATSA